MDEDYAIADLLDRTIIVRDGDGVVLRWNREAEQVYGWPRTMAVGQIIHGLLATSHPLSVGEVERRIRLNGEWSGEV